MYILWYVIEIALCCWCDLMICVSPAYAGMIPRFAGLLGTTVAARAARLAAGHWGTEAIKKAPRKAGQISKIMPDRIDYAGEKTGNPGNETEQSENGTENDSCVQQEWNHNKRLHSEVSLLTLYQKKWGESMATGKIFVISFAINAALGGGFSAAMSGGASEPRIRGNDSLPWLLHPSTTCRPPGTQIQMEQPAVWWLSGEANPLPLRGTGNHRPWRKSRFALQ